MQRFLHQQTWQTKGQELFGISYHMQGVKTFALCEQVVQHLFTTKRM